MHQLKIFVSSTCYDLKQIRKDLQEFISLMGHQPIMSEFDSFPIDPNNDTIANCIKNVESADLFVLVIGGRYGYVLENGKSITNMEYIYARKKGIPIFVYINRNVTTGLILYKDNPTGNFKSLVDDTKVFDFVNDVRTLNQQWCYDFDHAQDITFNLKIRFSLLFSDALAIRSRMHSDDRDELWKAISPSATAIALRKDDSYELKFLKQVLRDELAKYQTERYDQQYDVLLGHSNVIKSCRETNKFLSRSFHDFIVIVQSAGNVMNVAFKYFWGEPGTPADLYGLFYVANRLAKVYGEMLIWVKRIKTTEVPEYYTQAKKLAAEYSKDSLENIWHYPDKIQDAIDLHVTARTNGGVVKIKINLELESDQQIIDDFLNEMSRLTNFFGANPNLWD
jgi:hypothetical protein